MKLLIILSVCLVTVFSLDFDTEWKNFQKKHNKNYYEIPLKCNSRKKNFKANFEAIHAHNSNPTNTYKLNVTDYSDLSYDEFRRMLASNKNMSYIPGACKRLNNNRLKRSLPNAMRFVIGKHRNIQESDVPSEIDWREKIDLGPVQNQGDRGDCWAFATIGVLEAHISIKKEAVKKSPHNKVEFEKLSEQELIDCVEMPPDEDIPNCDEGGMHFIAFDYILTEGISPAAQYPKTLQKQICDESKMTIKRYNMFGYRHLPIKKEEADEEELKKVLAFLGPVATSIATPESIQNYGKDSGILNDPTCNRHPPNHYVLIVGYGENPEPYWLIKNSWGPDWGDDGYMKLARNKGNMCHVASEAFYPLVNAKG